MKFLTDEYRACFPSYPATEMFDLFEEIFLEKTSEKFVPTRSNINQSSRLEEFRDASGFVLGLDDNDNRFTVSPVICQS